MNIDELKNVITVNFEKLSLELEKIYTSYYDNDIVNNNEFINEFLNDFNTIVEEYVKYDNEINVNVLVYSIKKLLSAMEQTDTMLISDVLQFEFKEYLQYFFDRLNTL